MKKIKDYIKLIPLGIKNFDKIVEGIKTDALFNSGKLTDEEASEIINRRIICDNCPFLSTNAIKNNTYKSSRPDEHCSLCQCNKQYKTSCLSCNCGIEVYNEENPDNILELKWKAFKPNNDEKN